MYSAFSFFDARFDDMFDSNEKLDNFDGLDRQLEQSIMPGSACKWSNRDMKALISELFDANSLRRLVTVANYGNGEIEPNKAGCNPESRHDSQMKGTLMDHPESPDEFVTVLLQLMAYDSMALKVKTLQVLMAHLGEKEQLVRIMSTVPPP